MIIFKTASEISDFLATQQQKGKTCGFVPTMGALHAGHLSLITECRKHNHISVCSIFINPTQFNNQKDFQLYPVTIEKDIEVLIQSGCDVLFLPPLHEIYTGDHLKKNYSIGEIEWLVEGAFRPGHFQGVCEVVDRLLDIIHPDDLYLGQKDFQQCMVIKELIKITEKENKVKLHVVPTMREHDGLAMSSRNLRLSPADRKKAPLIYETLKLIRSEYKNTPAAELEKAAIKTLTDNGFIVDYVSIVNKETLQHITDPGEPAVALVAASISEIRLIDNLDLN